MARSVMDERTLARLAEELQGAFLEGGQRDLRKLRLVDLETEVMDAALGLARQTMSGVLRAQAEQVGNEPCCPACQQPLEVQPPQTKALKTRAGRVAWKQPAERCPACRRDFFPSGGSSGM